MQMLSSVRKVTDFVDRHYIYPLGIVYQVLIENTMDIFYICNILGKAGNG
jgi:hypothetical protein